MKGRFIIYIWLKKVTQELYKHDKLDWTAQENTYKKYLVSM